MLAVTMALILAGAACTTGRGTVSSTLPTTTSSGVTTTTLDATRAAILAAYRAGWADFIAVASKYPINPLDPRLRLHATGRQLVSVQANLARLSSAFIYEVGTLDLNPQVTSVEGQTATIMECNFDHFVDVDGRSGKPVSQPDIGHTLLRFTMTEINGAWFVSNSTTLKSGRTIDACTPGRL